MVRSSSSTLWWTVRAYVSSGAGSPAPNSSSDMPTMPFIGVRISWLIIARKRDLAWLAASAWALSASASTASRSRWRTMRSTVPKASATPSMPVIAMAPSGRRLRHQSLVNSASGTDASMTRG
jgi:hypothetical protein